MANTTKGLITLAIVAFILAVISVIIQRSIMGVSAEGFSRASSNLALIALAIGMCWKPAGTPA